MLDSPAAAGTTDRRSISFDELHNLLARIFVRHGCSPRVADILAWNCASAERDGTLSHGVFRMPGYVSTLKSGWVDGCAEPVVHDAAPGFIRVDAANGFAQVALADARDLLVRKARTNGIAVLAIRNSHHFGALSLDVEPFAEEGLAALSLVNSMRSVAPYGAHAAVYGTNPIALAAPRESAAPFVFDLATSTRSNGDVQIAAREGHTLPPGTGIARHGQPTGDPGAILDGGALLPFGGHKGSTIAMMVEILCAALVGGQFSYEVDLSGHPGAQTPRSGQTVIVIDPCAGSQGLAPFGHRVDQLIATIREAGQDRLPGDRRHAARSSIEITGITLPATTLQSLEDYLSDSAKDHTIEAPH